MNLDKSYNPHDIESRWYHYWEGNGYFSPTEPDPQKSSYCIMIPPPNVTGSLHMGHAFQDTIMDTLTRYHRMLGDRTLWQPGMDHAGIATQMVVERLLNAQGQNRHDCGREQFIEKVWQWKNESGGIITQQLRRMGASPDWENERFTLDDGLSDAVNEVFISLFDEGLIYRGKRLVNWDPVLHTALSDLEVLSAEETGSLWHLRYPLTDSADYLVVATTRPETMLGDSAVAVHPNDERYQHLVGQFVTLPLCHRRIPIIADEYVDPEFGTGCVKITPAHDFNDYQVWIRHRHNKEMTNQIHGGLINVFTDDASIRRNCREDNVAGKTADALIPNDYVGLDRFEARKKIITDLDAQALLERVDARRLMIPRGDRSAAVIEPYLTDQWYVDLTRDKLADGRLGGKAKITDPAIEAVKNGAIEFVPDNWSKTYFQWLENIEDWCISRQIWWGHRIPAWYDEQENIYVGKTEQHVRHKYALADDVRLRQDEDVLDTWFSSALWPFSTLGWPQQTERLNTFYPTSVLVTGFDIIFFWVARMIMMGTKFIGQVPFRQVYIHGLIRDAQGQKMSKSKGNVLDPIDLIDGIELEALVAKRVKGMMQPHLAEKIAHQTRKDYPDGIPSFGADALRFTFATLASNGRDINFDLGRIEGYRNFCNKIWNAARFVLLNNESKDSPQNDAKNSAKATLSTADKWIISQLQRSTLKIEEAISRYRFDLVAQEIYDLVWNKYCDWYLELCKPILNNENNAQSLQIGSRQTLVTALETILRLAHPIMPFITEEIWQRIVGLSHKGNIKRDETIMTQPYPRFDVNKIDADAEQEMEWVMQFILGIRKIKGELDIAPAKRVPVLLSNASARDIERVKNNRMYLDSIAKIESIATLGDADEQPDSSIAMLGNMKILIPIAGLIDKDAELERLSKLAYKIQNEHDKTTKKLANPGFSSKAPTQVVANEKKKLAEIKVKMVGISKQIEKISAL